MKYWTILDSNDKLCFHWFSNTTREMALIYQDRDTAENSLNGLCRRCGWECNKHRIVEISIKEVVQ